LTVSNWLKFILGSPLEKWKLSYIFTKKVKRWPSGGSTVLEHPTNNGEITDLNSIKCKLTLGENGWEKDKI